MSGISIKRIAAAVTLSLFLTAPVPALAAVNPDAQSAAAAGIQYLANNQNADGHISGFGGESDWSAEAVQAGGQTAAAFAHGGASLLDFLKADVPPANTSTTALERKIIAIAATGQNPADFGGVNYTALLAAQHQNGQLGDTALLNDDIFGIIAIDAAHDASLIPAAQDALDYLLAHQAADGGFSYTTDTCAWCGDDNNDTAAALIAIYAAGDLGLTHNGLATAKSQALAYLLSTQQSDGGFGYDPFSPSDGSSTSWSLMALNALGGTVATQAAQARDWLLQNQNADGGFSFGAYGTTSSDTYTTAHAITALLGTTWLLRPAPIGSAVPSQQSSGGLGAGVPAQTRTAHSGFSTGSRPAGTTGQATGGTLDGTTGDDNTASSTPQVKGASTKSGQDKSAASTAAGGKSEHTYGIYAAILLSLAAVIWFVLESRKSSRRANI